MMADARPTAWAVGTYGPEPDIGETVNRRMHPFRSTRVADTGTGIAHEDIPKAMSPFGQVDSALNRKYRGYEASATRPARSS